ncbi:14 kDa zinc-binding protein [Thraustotheca clavata]|uniref:14 kDa zinc-binding protein n=1 Tax=Thraustotheca clavata TaxID=74557 RepID=A0A1V9YXV0_9STRA|nr:14 kDa zinc-binding protein [Thraustotheca clavata]
MFAVRSCRVASKRPSQFYRWMSTEADKARAAAEPQPHEPTIFDKIINKEIPANVIYENDKVLAFRDISPQSPTHVLVIPKVRAGLTRLIRAEEKHKEILGELLYTASVVARNENLEDGYRVVINDGKNGCQSVYHLHLHIIGGRPLGWPPVTSSLATNWRVTLFFTSDSMVVLRDECSLLLIWLVQGVCVLPALALTAADSAVIIFGLFLLASSSGFLLSFSSTCQHRRACQFVSTAWIAWVFYTLQSIFIAVLTMTIYNFLLPFTSGVEFQFYCKQIHLEDNLSSTPCSSLQGKLAISLVILTVDVCLAFMILVIGRRIVQKQYIEYTRVQKEIEKANNSPSQDTLLGQHV